MSEVGSLIIKVQADTAQLKTELAKTKEQLAALGGTAQKTGKVMKESMQDPRESVMLLGTEVGVVMPRALSMFISKLPGVGTALNAAFPIIGIVAVIGIIAKLIEKHEALQQAIHKAAEAYAESAIKQADNAKALDLTNLKLDDQIARLEHKPSHNYMKEALLETSEEMDKLASTYASDFAKMDEHLQTQIGFWHQVGSAMALAYAHGDANATEDSANQQKAMQALATASTKVLDARTAMANAPMTKAGQLAAENNLVKALWGQVAAANWSRDAFKGNVTEVLRYAQAAADATSEVHGMNQEMEASGKKQTIAKLEQSNANLAPLKDEANLQKIIAEGVDKHNQALIRLASTQAETSMAAGKGGEDDSIEGKLAKQKAAIAAETSDEIKAAQSSLAAKKAAYDADLKAAGNDLEKKKELTAQYANDVRAGSDSIAQFNASANKQIVSAERDAANQRLAIEKSYNQTVSDDALKVAELQASISMKAAEQYAKSQETIHRETRQQILANDIAGVNAETSAEVAGFNARLANLDKFDKDYLKKVQQLQTDITMATMRGDAQVATLTNASQQQYLATVKNAQDRAADAVATDVAKSIVSNKSLAASLKATGEQMVEGMIKNLLVAEMTGEKQKLIDAKSAAGKSYDWASTWGGPIAGAVAGAAAFAGVMSFEVGGKIPGEGPVPIVGHGGETVVTKALTDQVESSKRNGGSGGGETHMHYSPQIHAVDSTGVDAMLTKHATTFQKHISQAMRRANR